MRGLELEAAQAPNNSEPLRSSIGRYQILSEVGRGAMGIVYGALDPAIRRAVAIKVVRLDGLASSGDTASLRDRFVREARAAGSLHHPNIVSLYDVGEQDGIDYIVMELVNGQTLETLLAPGQPRKADAAVAIVRQIASALDYLHTKGIVHRDLKPSNVLMSDEGQVKLTDFGIAKIAADANLTSTGMLIGTPHYMSPEQIIGRPVTPKADQFALAVLTYQLLSGTRPFEAEDTMTLVFRIAEGAPDPLSRIRQDLPAGVDRPIDKAMSKDPACRYRTCGDFVDALEAELRGPEPVIPIPVPVAKAPRTARKLLRIAASIGTMLLTAAFVFASILAVHYFYSRPARSMEQPAAKVESLPARKPDVKRPAHQPKPAGAPVATHVEVQITSEPAGAIAVIDGDVGLTCATPCSFPLTPGRHTVVVNLSGFVPQQKVFQTLQKTIAIQLGPSVGTPTGSSTPDGARIVMDGRDTGTVTPVSVRLDAFGHRLELAKAGYQQVEIPRSEWLPAER